jgi:hypothetical protein
VKFKWDVEGQDHPDIGLIAEEVDLLYPGLVPKDEEGLPYSVSYDKLSLLLIEQLKVHKREIDMMKERIASLEKN